MNKQKNIPTIFTIFGVTGDLSTHKLLPALFDLYIRGLLPSKFFIIGFSRKSWSQKEFKNFVEKAIKKKGHNHKSSDIKSFISQCYYIPGLFEEANDFDILKNIVADQEERFGQCTNKLYYLAVPPWFYSDILKNLKKNELHTPCSDVHGWARILIEKPFGQDISTAQKLNKQLTKVFQEEQIFRIDHYLAKEMVENILYFRFLNSIYEPIWNHEYIEKVHIELCEKIGIRGRGSFYDGLGALRDVGQNHMLQMLALIALEKPRYYTPESLQNARLQVFKSLKKITKTQLKNFVTRGQYIGFNKEKNVAQNSTTETYFKMAVELNSLRWKNVPFILESGKALHKNEVKITIFFQRIPSCFCPNGTTEAPQNILQFIIQPEQQIKITFGALGRQLDRQIISKELHMNTEMEDHDVIPDAYEKVLYDCIQGDRTLFPSNEEEEASWKFITHILKNWDIVPLKKYKRGSKGPK